MSVPHIRSFDELSVGQSFAFGEVDFTREAIMAFGQQWDPQYLHIDEQEAKRSIYGGLIASGLHTQCACFQQMMRSGIFGTTSIGGVGMDVRWTAPVYPGDRLAVTATIEELIASKSRRDRGVAKTRVTGTRAQDGAVVIEMLITHFLKR